MVMHILAVIVVVFGLWTSNSHASARADAGPVEDFEAAMLAEDYVRAVTLAQGLVAEYPESSTAYWHLGCALSQAGQLDAAVAALVRSAELGFSGTRSVRDEADLDPIRTHPHFPRVVEAVAAAATRRLERFQAVAKDAEPTVILPPGHDPSRPTPLLIALHGTGGNGASMVKAWRAAARTTGAILIAPDALRPAGAGPDAGYSWTYRDESEWYVLDLIRWARERWAVDRVVLTGFSQGANIALMLGQSHASVFDAVIPVGGHYEPDTATIPLEGTRPRWGLIIGADDPWAATYVAAERAFSGAGMVVRHHAIAGLGHAFPTGRDRTRLTEVLIWGLEGPRRDEPSPAPAAPRN